MAVAAQPVITKALEAASRRYLGFMEAEIATEDGCLVVKLTMKGRDQWWVHRKQWSVMAGAVAVLRAKRSDLSEPIISRLPQRTGHGRYQ